MANKIFNKNSVYEGSSQAKAKRDKPHNKRQKTDNTLVHFDENASGVTKFDFDPYYGKQIDEVTSACQQSVEIMLEETNIEHSTIYYYCSAGMANFLPFCQLMATGLQRPLQLADIDKSLLGQFITHLKASDAGYTSQKNYYTYTKSVIKKMAQLKWIEGTGLYPKNPFPNSNKHKKGQKTLSKKERHQVVHALKAELKIILNGTQSMTSYELTVCMLAIAARSGINPQPLIELPLDCIQPHPLKSSRFLLVSYKRRGNTTHIQSLRKTEDIELMNTVMPDVVVIIEAVIRRNESIRKVSLDYSNDVFVFEHEDNRTKGRITLVSKKRLDYGIKTFSQKHQLTNDMGQSLQLNIMRLRKTFENRIFHLSGGDPWVTAKLGGHSLKVSNDHYLEAPEDAEKNFRFYGEVRTQELLQSPEIKTLPAENTPVSKCRDPLKGHFAPKAEGEYCTNFLACVRCRSFVVTGDDLYRLYSFYWLVVYERNTIGVKNWSNYFAHVIRIIDKEIAPKFDAVLVQTARDKAKANPHPFWKNLKLPQGEAV